MYEQHFGLNKRPFRATNSGSDVFVGPQMAVMMAGLKKALTSVDSVAIVQGPVGCGKTTIVNRALESLGGSPMVIPIGRMRLNSADVLDLLLERLGGDEKPPGMIQKFAAFRRQLASLENNGTRLFITVEDGVHLGTETLAELEALTAADAGEADGASVVIMADNDFDTVLGTSALARLRQRVRQRYSIGALSAAELRGYLKHSFRLAGGDFEKIFDNNSAPLLHHLSEGIPRIANNIVESSLAAAMAQDLSKVTSELLARVAENEYALSAAGFEFNAKPTMPAPPAPEAKPEPRTEPKKPPPVAAADSMESDIPDLIQDTLPDLSALAPELMNAKPSEIPQLQVEASHELKPQPEPAPAPAPDVTPITESPGADVPDWEKDPTLAELRPDFDALEEALALTATDDTDLPTLQVEPKRVREPETLEEIPEITLDMAISQRIESNLIDEPGEVSAPPKPADSPAPSETAAAAVATPPKEAARADSQLNRMATELARAKSLEDVDDKMAETLFGEDLNFIASQVLANPPPAESANDDLELELVAAPEQQVANGSESANIEITLDAEGLPQGGATDLSATQQRLQTVRSLNSTAHAPAQVNDRPAVKAKPATRPAKAPDSIEDQITSMTATLKTLKMPAGMLDDDEDDDQKGGFFSRFKRS